jgi:hypothetical protein
LVLDEGKSVGSVARESDRLPTALRECARWAQADRTEGRTGLTTAEHEEFDAAAQGTSHSRRSAKSAEGPSLHPDPLPVLGRDAQRVLSCQRQPESARRDRQPFSRPSTLLGTALSAVEGPPAAKRQSLIASRESRAL